MTSDAANTCECVEPDCPRDHLAASGREDVEFARSYEVVVLVAPCAEEEVEGLMLAIASLPECENVGGVVTSRGSLNHARDLEWEVAHKKSKVHKGRGPTPEVALRDLRDGFALGVVTAREEVEREQKRLDKLTALLDETEVRDGD